MYTSDYYQITYHENAVLCVNCDLDCTALTVFHRILLTVRAYIRAIHMYIIYIYVSTHTLKHTYTHIYLHTYIYTHIPTYIHTYIHKHIYIYIYTHAYIYIHIHACIHTYTHTHTYVRTHARMYKRTTIYSGYAMRWGIFGVSFKLVRNR